MARSSRDLTVSVSIDFGANATKVAYAYKNESGDYFCDLLFENGIPSMAYYDVGKNEWIFDKKEILAHAQSSFRYLVKIKDLLGLCETGDKLYKKKFFKDFYYPPKESETYQDAVNNDHFFTAEQTPKEVCAAFAKYCIQKIESALKEKGSFSMIRYVVVYPANTTKEYISELVNVVAKAAGQKESDVWIVSAPRAVGLAAKHFKVATNKKNVLLFNVGEEYTSVVKASFDKDNVYVYGADGHNPPEKIGGKNVDIALSNYLFEKSNGIQAFGEQAVGQDVEKGVFFDQFRMQEGINAGKKVFSNGEAYENLGGFMFSVYREMTTNVKVVKAEFKKCCASFYERVWAYVNKELKRSSNSDVDAIIFSGGAADTFGLDSYVEGALAEKYKKVTFFDFSPKNKEKGYDDVLCAAKDTVPIGAALLGVGKYSFKLRTSYSYGTYSTIKSSNRCKFAPFINKGDTINFEPKLNFTKKEYSSSIYPCGAGAYYDKESNRHYIFNEYYKCIPDDEYIGREIIFDEGFAPTAERKEKNVSKTFIGKAKLGAKLGNEITFETIGFYLMFFRCPKDYHGNKDEVVKDVLFQEGFELDFEGRVTPIVKNRSTTYPQSAVELSLEPNGTREMTINN